MSICLNAKANVAFIYLFTCSRLRELEQLFCDVTQRGETLFTFFTKHYIHISLKRIVYCQNNHGRSSIDPYLTFISCLGNESKLKINEIVGL